jgi:hypothetical protein
MPWKVLEDLKEDVRFSKWVSTEINALSARINAQPGIVEVRKVDARSTSDEQVDVAWYTCQCAVCGRAITLVSKPPNKMLGE